MAADPRGAPSGVLSAPVGPSGVLSALVGPSGVLSALVGPSGGLSALVGPSGVLSALVGPSGVLSALVGPSGVLSALVCPSWGVAADPGGGVLSLSVSGVEKQKDLLPQRLHAYHGAGGPARGVAAAVPLGGPNTSELCMWSESHHHLDGIPRNPHHLERGQKAARWGPGDRGGLGPRRQYSYGLFLQRP
ncbi:unnamed protein product [Gadus morhua 'NCC']